MQKHRLLPLGLFLCAAFCQGHTTTSSIFDPNEFTRHKCVEENNQDCIKAECYINPESDCAAQCQRQAEQKCQAIAEQQL